MEYVGQQNIKKLCNFYVSDLHLSVMLLPYISKQINEDVEITTIFEKLEKNDMKAILDKINVKNKSNILNINWLENNEKIYKNTEEAIKKSIRDNKKVTIIVGGNQNYISKNNSNIMKILNENNTKEDVKIVNCYNVEEIGLNMKEIVKKYDGILNTLGETKV